jgi:hypothetical protein
MIASEDGRVTKNICVMWDCCLGRAQKQTDTYRFFRGCFGWYRKHVCISLGTYSINIIDCRLGIPYRPCPCKCDASHTHLVVILVWYSRTSTDLIHIVGGVQPRDIGSYRELEFFYQFTPSTRPRCTWGDKSGARKNYTGRPHSFGNGSFGTKLLYRATAGQSFRSLGLSISLIAHIVGY